MRRTPQPYRNGELVIVIDCSDLERSARFWSGVLGCEAGAVTGGPYRSLIPADGVGIEVLLQRVPERKAGKNRLHLTCARRTWTLRWRGSGASARRC